MNLPPWARVGLVLFVVLMVQLTIVIDVRIWGVSTSVLVVVPILAGLVAGPERGAAVGFVAGLAIDAFLTTPFGLTALVWTVAGYVMGRMGHNLIRSSTLTVVGLAVLASVASIAAFVLVGLLLGQDHLLQTPVLRIAVVGAAVAALATPVLAPAVRWAFTDPRDPVRIRR